MPELPEVETVRLQLEDRLCGRRVTEAWAHPSAKFAPASNVIGATFGPMWRRGKYLMLPATGHDGAELEMIIHLGMTGRLSHHSMPAEGDNPHLRAWWSLDDTTTLTFVDIRRFGRIRVVAKGDYGRIPTLANIGPEPFDPALDAETFWALLRRSRRPIKTQLLSQRPIAGVGNIYADEALWLARINPKVRRLGRERAARLLSTLREVLDQGLTNGGTTLRDYRDATGATGSNQYQLMAYGRASGLCHRCADTMKSDQIDGRTTTWCPTCQRR